MGGSGGGGSLPRTPPEELKQRIREYEKLAADHEFNAEVAHRLEGILASINDRDSNAVERRLGDITDALEEEIEGSLSTLFGGSVNKHTYVDGISDIDSLVILNKSELKDMAPNEVLSYFAEKLTERFPKQTVRRGQLAATIEFEDAEVQLLPAIRIGRRLRISSPDGNSWSEINPRRFQRQLTETNEKNGRKVVPLIKLIKSFNDSQPEGNRLSGYHMEALAIGAFRNYKGPMTIAKMAEHFFSTVPDRIRTPIRDKTGQSVYVDEYLGPRNNPTRRRIGRAYERVYRELRNANGAKDVDQWVSTLTDE